MREGLVWPRALSRHTSPNTTPHFPQRLHRIVASAPCLGPTSRVIDVGAGTGCLIPPLRAAGVCDVLAVDVSPAMLARLTTDHAASTTLLGNDPGVRTWLGDIESVPPYQGPADAIFFNAVFGNVASQPSALIAASLLLRPGGHIIVSHPLGRTWHGRLRDADPETVPHRLPDAREWEALIGSGLPLRLVRLVDEDECYIAVLQVSGERGGAGVESKERSFLNTRLLFLLLRPHDPQTLPQLPPALTLPPPPLLLTAPVVTGFGRGSRSMGVPTANLDTGVVGSIVAGRPRGVYFGCVDFFGGWRRVWTRFA